MRPHRNATDAEQPAAQRTCLDDSAPRSGRCRKEAATVGLAASAESARRNPYMHCDYFRSMCGMVPTDHSVQVQKSIQVRDSFLSSTRKTCVSLLQRRLEYRNFHRQLRPCVGVVCLQIITHENHMSTSSTSVKEDSHAPGRSQGLD
jgi:hypothetical protein